MYPILKHNALFAPKTLLSFYLLFFFLNQVFIHIDSRDLRDNHSVLPQEAEELPSFHT